MEFPTDEEELLRLTAKDKAKAAMEFSEIGFNPIDDEELRDLIVKDKTTTKLQFPEGFRFSPTDEELIDYYLKPAILGKKDGFDTIGLLNIYAHDPWDLPGLAKTAGWTATEWYFFVPIERKQNRASKSGYWKAIGLIRPIRSLSDGDRVIGLKKTLVFYTGRAAYGCRTNWVMHEYILPETCNLSKENLVLCKIYDYRRITLKEMEQTTAKEKETKVTHEVSPRSLMVDTSSFPQFLNFAPTTHEVSPRSLMLDTSSLPQFLNFAPTDDVLSEIYFDEVYNEIHKDINTARPTSSPQINSPHEETAMGKAKAAMEFSEVGTRFNPIHGELPRLTAKDKKFQLPEGYRFKPTDEELIDYYLRKAVLGDKDRFDTIGFLNIYNHEPWDLPALAQIAGEECWYFFVQIYLKPAKRGGLNRITSTGCWKKTGKDRLIQCGSEQKGIGLKRTLIFYHRGSNSGLVKTQWIMHEYIRFDSPTLTKEHMALCKIFRKKGKSLEEGEQTNAMGKDTKITQNVSPPSTVDVLSFSDLQTSTVQTDDDDSLEIKDNLVEHVYGTANPGTQSQLPNQSEEESTNEAKMIMSTQVTSAATTPTASPQINPPEDDNVFLEALHILWDEQVSPELQIEDEKKLIDTITSAAAPSTSSPHINPPKVELGISCGNVVASNRMLGGFQIEQGKQVSLHLKNEAEKKLILDNITSSAAAPSTSTPQVNPGLEVEISCGNAITSKRIMVDAIHIEQDKQMRSESKNLAEKELMVNITSAAGPSTSSPPINPEVDVGISTCGNIIVPKGLVRGFHNEQHNKQVSGGANQIQSNLLQVSPENGTNVLITTEEATVRKIDGMGKGSDSRNPRIVRKGKGFVVLLGMGKL